MKEVVAKLAGMRKEQSFVVYPRPSNALPAYNMIKVQSERAIGLFDADTGEGVLNWRGSNAKYNPHLSTFMGAEPFTFPQEFIRQCKEVQPKKGDIIGGILMIG